MNFTMLITKFASVIVLNNTPHSQHCKFASSDEQSMQRHHYSRARVTKAGATPTKLIWNSRSKTHLLGKKRVLQLSALSPSY